MTPSTAPAAPPPLPAPPAEPRPVWREYAAAMGIVALTTWRSLWRLRRPPPAPPPPLPAPPAEPRPVWREYASAIGIVALSTSLCFALRPRLQTVDEAMVLLLGVVAVAALCRRGPAVLASVLSIAVFDFVFVPPYYTFGVHDTAYFLTFVVMFAV